MAIIKAFRGYRPLPELVARIASPPYDVLNSDEAREEVAGNPHSFLHVVKPEVDLPRDLDPHDPLVYATARDNFTRLRREGVFFQDDTPCLYLYRQEMDGKRQTGIVAAAAVSDYFEGHIKKHELTRPDKEEDRMNHVRVANMNAEPVFFAYPGVTGLDALIAQLEETLSPVYDFVTEDGIGHTFWVVDEPATIDRIVRYFAEDIPATYVADGHHRTAAAALVGQERQKQNPAHTGQEDYNYFLAVHFPDHQLRIIDYNRVVRDLNGHSAEAFLAALEKSFVLSAQDATYKPDRLHTFGMYLDGTWYRLEARPGTYDDNDPIGVLDVTILSEQVLAPLLGITDLRRDQRIDFVGGIRGLGELERRVDSGEMRVAFALYPVTMQQLMDIADSGAIMPPKTTWFEPKLRSGLVVHALGELDQ
ncbi:MAG: DUF1015 domain-containing protein [Bacteroidetes bacterium]|nr:MAG: DUF1015 domain-containing protein [Bacteroidota bacterium]